MTERHVYEGEVFVRMLNRGVELYTDDGTDVHFDDWLAGALGIEPYTQQGGARIRLTLEILSEVKR